MTLAEPHRRSRERTRGRKARRNVITEQHRIFGLGLQVRVRVITEVHLTRARRAFALYFELLTRCFPLSLLLSQVPMT